MYRESETLEKKSSFAAWKEIIISLSAFAKSDKNWSYLQTKHTAKSETV